MIAVADYLIVAPGASDDCGRGRSVRNIDADQLSPPVVRSPKLVQGVGFAFFRRKAMQRWIRRHGRIFEINVPFFGRSSLSPTRIW